ncbi:MAG: hypothetical protein V3U68_03860 [Bacteroidota bacterium]
MFTTTVTGFAQDRALRKRQEKAFTRPSNDISGKPLAEETRNYTLEAVRTQRALGLDVPDMARSDYPDEIGAMALTLVGFELDLTAGGMSRHSITNTYISKPSVSGAVRFHGDIASNVPDNGTKLKTSLPGIYTLASRSMDPHSKDFDALLDGLVPAYTDALSKLQTRYVQFNEYELLRNPTIENINRVKNVYQKLNFSGKKILAFYFGDIQPIVEHLDELPVEVIHLDVFHGSNTDQLLHRAPRTKEIILGLLDTVQYRSDDEASVVRTAKKFAEKIDPRKLWLSTNGDLVYRGRSFAESKINMLIRIANKLRS